MTKTEIVMVTILFCGFITIQALGTDTGASGSGILEIPAWVK